MSFLDYLAPRRGPGRSRLTKTLYAKIGLYTSVVAVGVFILVSVLRDDRYVEPEPIPATRNSVEVIDEVQRYLQTATHTGFLRQDELASCWDVFEDKKFNTEYLQFGAWRIDAFYEQVRYFWRVDDVTMEVTRDYWLEPWKQNQLTHPTIEC